MSLLAVNNYHIHFSQLHIKHTAYRWRQVSLFVSQFVHIDLQYREALLEPQYSGVNTLCWLTKTSCRQCGTDHFLKTDFDINTKSHSGGLRLRFLRWKLLSKAVSTYFRITEDLVALISSLPHQNRPHPTFAWLFFLFIIPSPWEVLALRGSYLQRLTLADLLHDANPIWPQ